MAAPKKKAVKKSKNTVNKKRGASPSKGVKEKKSKIVEKELGTFGAKVFNLPALLIVFGIVTLIGFIAGISLGSRALSKVVMVFSIVALVYLGFQFTIGNLKLVLTNLKISFRFLRLPFFSAYSDVEFAIDQVVAYETQSSPIMTRMSIQLEDSREFSFYFMHKGDVIQMIEALNIVAVEKEWPAITREPSKLNPLLILIPSIAFGVFMAIVAPKMSRSMSKIVPTMIILGVVLFLSWLGFYLRKKQKEKSQL